MSTPRTDAELIMAGYAPYCVVPTSFARELEREVESLSAQVAELKKDAERYRERYEWLRARLPKEANENEWDTHVDAMLDAAKESGVSP